MLTLGDVQREVRRAIDELLVRLRRNVLTAAPTGSIIMHGAEEVPNGWLRCNGAAVSRADYSDLFAKIGTQFGVGNGSTTFNLPDMRQRFALGVAVSGTGSVLGETGGQIDHTHEVFCCDEDEP